MTIRPFEEVLKPTRIRGSLARNSGSQMSEGHCTVPNDTDCRILRSRDRNAPGVVPVCLLNNVVKWLWQEQPTSSAMSQILRSLDARRFIAFLIRRRITY
jgi:hypothetical protein